MSPDPVDDLLARFTAAQPSDHAQRLVSLETQMTVNTAVLAALIQKTQNLEESLMATAEEFAGRLDTATNEIASDLQDLRDQLQSVRNEIPAAQQAAVDDALAKLDAPIARLEALGQDPANPVPVDPGTGGGAPTPTPEPTPVNPGDGGVVSPGDGTDIVNPTPNPDVI